MLRTFCSISHIFTYIWLCISVFAGIIPLIAKWGSFDIVCPPLSASGGGGGQLPPLPPGSAAYGRNAVEYWIDTSSWTSRCASSGWLTVAPCSEWTTNDTHPAGSAVSSRCWICVTVTSTPTTPRNLIHHTTLIIDIVIHFND